MAEAMESDISPTPPNPLHECLKVAVMSAAGATHFMYAYQIVTIKDMLLLWPIKSQDLINMYNGKQTGNTKNVGVDV